MAAARIGHVARLDKPALLAGLHERIELELVDRQELRSGAVAVRYRPR